MSDNSGTTAHSPPRSKALRIIELGSGLSGRICGRLFAGLGEDVVTLRLPDADNLQQSSDHDRGSSFLGQGKRRPEPDTAEFGIMAAAALNDADVAIVDSAALKAGFDTAEMRRRWPDLVIVCFTTLGLTEPADLPEDSLLAEAFGGLATMIGEPGRKPLQLGNEQASFAASFVGFLGVVLALRRRNMGHGGDVVDVALADVMAYIDWKSDILVNQTGQAPSRTGTSGGAWRIVDAVDGKVGIIFQPDQWDLLVRLVGDPRLADPDLKDARIRQGKAESWWPVIREWAAARPKLDIYHQAQALGLPFGFEASVADLVQSPQYRARGFVQPGASSATGPLFRSDRLTWDNLHPAAPETGSDAAHAIDQASSDAPLAGLRVLDLGTITAGAATGRLLADYGASVIKVESGSRPDPFRQWSGGGPFEPGESPMFDSNNAGKLGIDLDLTDAGDRNHLYALVREAHVVIENFRVGVTEKLGIDQATLRHLNPQLIYLSLSSQGQSGPEARYRSYGSTLDLLSGLASVTGYSGGGPIWSSVEVNYPDQLVSLFGAGLVAYCALRDRHGLMLDVSQREVVSWTLSSLLEEYKATGHVAAPRGNERNDWLPHDVYPCKGDDRWIAICCATDKERAAVARILDLPEAAARHGWWASNRVLGDTRLSDWTRVRERDDIVRQLATAGVACAAVHDAKDRVNSPHFLKRRVFLSGPPRRKGFPFVMQGYQPPVPASAPAVGEHNELFAHGLWPEQSRPGGISGRESIMGAEV
ncbi:MAG: CoA transferase [Rhizobiaceae bacterium]|nr:CoA transferase [Rhizobiaceae bacterium]